MNFRRISKSLWPHPPLLLTSLGIVMLSHQKTRFWKLDPARRGFAVWKSFPECILATELPDCAELLSCRYWKVGMWRYDHDNRGSLLKIALDVGIFLQKTGIKNLNLNFSPHLYQLGCPTDLKGWWSWQHLFQLFLQSSHGMVCIFSYSYMYCCLAPSQVHVSRGTWESGNLTIYVLEFWGPLQGRTSGRLGTCLTSSFTPFVRSGRVTHATLQWLDSGLEKSKKSQINLKTIAKKSKKSKVSPKIQTFFNPIAGGPFRPFLGGGV